MPPDVPRWLCLAGKVPLATWAEPFLVAIFFGSPALIAGGDGYPPQHIIRRSRNVSGKGDPRGRASAAHQAA